MSEAMESSAETVYVPLLDEGTTVLRPAKAVRLKDRVYRLLAIGCYDAETEVWQFRPGQVVECAWEARDGIRVLVAQRAV